uniref:Fe-S cluster assembly protein SufD n=1 Tax=Candidatus Kentrum sp. TUN TaxID=2126343 RepID=A0A450ZFQ2_9GAMM|nr:MAG: Fe-S cluster assembly protein SufD [Candidatus Kentron sp. TUN]VFK53170.1 MAG: Fe-S cluster assembly protein SufD [Candidatus Kentron sp. TUN]VFK55728.1 MAG: Fe-S cluster assembly protein SufD [Candidatus Kentron sp. TUN]
MNIVDHYRAEFLSHETHFPGTGAAWLRQRRRDAFDRFAKFSFPSSHQEAWMHTPIDAITQRPYRSSDGGQLRDSETRSESVSEPSRNNLSHLYLPDSNSHCLVFLNGRYARQLSRPGNLPGGVIAGSLADNSDAYPEVLEKHLDCHVAAAAPSAGFAALNGAFWPDGAFVYLPAGVIVEAPIHLLFISTLEDEKIITHPRILIVAEENSAAAVVEHFTSLGGESYFTNAVTEISLGANANVKHCKIQNEANQALHIAMLQAYQAKDSHFASHSVSVGGRLTRNDINAVIGAEGGECMLDGLYMVNKRQHVDYHTRIEHTKSHSASRQRYKGVIAGKAHGVFNGQVYVHPDAQHTDAKQKNENLLLSPDAQMNTKPQLDIFADDVQCSHGATVGQLDTNMIFYLRARGIATDMATSLLTYGFVNEILNLAPVPAIKPRLGEITLSKLPNADKLKDQMLELVPHAV